jgi:hypothetical protein
MPSQPTTWSGCWPFTIIRCRRQPAKEKRFLGVPDEPLMYLAASATFLEAATSLNVDLVLHGHRHVEGLTRYSIPDPRATSSESGEAFWRTIYLLSCPSSTGQAGDDAGFNLVHFGPASHADRTEHRFAITRYTRLRNDAAFRPLDSNLSGGVIRLPAGRDFSRGPAVQSAIEVVSSGALKRDQVAAIVRRLFMRRGYFDEAEPNWASALYTYVVSAHAWAELERKAATSGPGFDIDALAAVRTLLGRLIEQSADVLGIDRAQLDELYGRGLINCPDFLRQVPRQPCKGIDLRRRARQRLQLLRDLDQQVKAFGLDLGLGGQAPPQQSPAREEHVGAPLTGR